MQTELFRRAAVDAQSDRLNGDVVLQQPFSTRLMTGVLLVVVVAAVIWVTLGTFSRTETAKGILAPVAGSSKIYALRPGVLTELLVHEGDVVEAGQRLAVVSTESPSASGSRAANKTLASLTKQEGIATRQLDLARRASASELIRLASTISGMRLQEKELRDQIAIQQQVVASSERTFDQLKSVVEKGFVSRLEFERRRQLSLAARQELSRLNQQLNSTQSDIVKAGQERERTLLDGESNQMAARSGLESLRQQHARTEGEASYLVEAPIAGRVTAIQTGAGRTVAGSVPLMIVMPERARLEADIYVPSRAIGFVRPGQEVRLLYDAFPYQRFGSFTARVETISRNVIAGSEIDAPFKIEEPVYRITATLAAEQIDAYGEHVRLQPGMTLVANIVLERRSFLDWLLDPLHAVTRRN